MSPDAAATMYFQEPSRGLGKATGRAKRRSPIVAAKLQHHRHKSHRDGMRSYGHAHCTTTAGRLQQANHRKLQTDLWHETCWSNRSFRRLQWRLRGRRLQYQIYQMSRVWNTEKYSSWLLSSLPHSCALTSATRISGRTGTKQSRQQAASSKWKATS